MIPSVSAFKPTALGAVAWALLVAASVAAPAASEQTDFFEKRIRPVLSEQCFKCHSSTAAKLKGGLMLDSREAMLKGGDTGPAVVPGDLENSLLVDAVRWHNKDLQMPPKKALLAEQVADLESWVKSGASWPQDAAAKAAAMKVFDLQKRRQEHWCWQRPVDTPPPTVKDAGWPQSIVDRFILAKLEEKGLKPAPDADRRTLIRRATFDLTGLPPTPEEVDAFIHDQSPDGFAKVINRLLASPHFGERWARHWLDLVRYAESRGHEYDYPIPNAWQYRDYVIRALNADVPYNQFAAEHIAGDLLPARLNPQTGADESILGTGFWFFGEEVHSPVDIRQDEADRMDNRLDVMTKTFLGLTVGCARCHDHKFDAISQRDYYALQGFLISSGYRQARFETLEADRQIARDLEQVHVSIRSGLLQAVADALQPRVGHLASELMAARTLLSPAHAAPLPAQDANDTAFIRNLAEELKAAAKDPDSPLYAFAKAATAPGGDGSPSLYGFLPVLADLGKREADSVIHFSPDKIVADYQQPGATRWMQDGFSYGSKPARAGDPLFGTSADRPLLGVNICAAAVHDSAWKPLAVKDSERDFGKLGEWERSGNTLRTPEATLTAERIFYLAKGSGCAYAVVNSHALINGPLHGGLLLKWKFADEQWHWIEHSLRSYSGHRMHVEFCPDDHSDFAVAMVVQDGEKLALPYAGSASLLEVLRDPAINSLATLAEATQRALVAACENLRIDQAGKDAPLADWLIRRLDLFAPAESAARRQLAEAARPLLVQQAKVTARIQADSHTAPAMFDGSGVNEFVLVRGQAKNPGAQTPRRFLEAVSGHDQPGIKDGSGRLELARHIVDPANPLTGRVIVNRVWHHLFGRGIVPSVDNFGVLGQRPSHRELLDSLAVHFENEQGWSLKSLIREIMLSRTYQMASKPADEATEEADPDNILLHRMNVRRLEGEAIRDAMLAVSNRLDPKMGGPGVPVHLTPFMSDRGRPKIDGPLDGAGRRSIYIAARRNFLAPMMQAFDLPVPFTTIGRRDVSNVPAQALILMNDPFVLDQAAVWARRTAPTADCAQRVRQMYLTAFSRPPTKEEISDATAFLDGQRALYAAKDPADGRAWGDFAHVLFNVKEFIYLN